VLSGLVPGDSDSLLVGFETADDAAVYQMGDDAILLTVDFFTPIVDDPFDFGRVTAANALSDIYAMGGRPLAVMNLLAFPCSLGAEVISEVLRGGAEKVREAGAVVVGGHTIDDDEPKFGLSVMGVVHPDVVVRNVGAKAGDEIFLTKRIGTGIMTTAVKGGLESDETIADVIDSMVHLNKAAAEAMMEVGVNAATDVTGFGVLGHLHEMVKASGLAACVYRDAIPVFDRALAYSDRKIRPGRTAEVIEYLDGFVDWGDTDQAWKGVLGDPQTSGGLLIAISSDRADALAKALESRGELVARIGQVTSGDSGAITVATRLP